MSSRRQPHPGGGRGLAGRCVATQLRGLALRLADPLAEAQPLLHLPQDPQPGIVDGIWVFLVYSINKSYHISLTGMFLQKKTVFNYYFLDLPYQAGAYNFNLDICTSILRFLSRRV